MEVDEDAVAEGTEEGFRRALKSSVVCGTDQEGEHERSSAEVACFRS